MHGDVLELRLAPATDALDLAWSKLNLGSILLFSGRSRAGWVGEGTLDLLEAALTIREAAFDRPEHRDRVEAAEALACAHLALAELGQPLEGRVLPDPSRAMGLCDSYALDSERMKVHAKQHVERARMFEAGQVVPPVRGRGQ